MRLKVDSEKRMSGEFCKLPSGGRCKLTQPGLGQISDHKCIIGRIKRPETRLVAILHFWEELLPQVSSSGYAYGEVGDNLISDQCGNMGLQ